MTITYYKEDGTVIADYDPTVLNNLDVGSYYAIVSLTNATNYNDATGRVDFDIIAVAPTINQAIEVVYNQPNMNGFFTTDMNISNITFAGSYNTEGTIVLDATQLTVGTNNYNYTFTPNSNNYTTATSTVSIIVKATVQFKDGDTVLETQYIAKDATISSFPTTTKTGYSLDGWYIGETKYTSQAITTNTTLVAKWTPTTYNIVIDLDGGTVATTNPTTYTIESNDITLNNPTKAGYIFTGWTGSNGNTTQQTVTITTGSTGDKNYKANWELLPAYELPTGLEATYGDKLSDIILPSNFEWVDDTQSVGDAGENEFDIYYIMDNGTKVLDKVTVNVLPIVIVVSSINEISITDTRSWDTLKSTDFITFKDLNGTTIDLTNSDYGLQGMYDGSYYYGTVSSTSGMSTTTYLVGSTYLATVKLNTSNYVFDNSTDNTISTTIVKYKTARIGYSSTTYFTVEDAIATATSSSQTIILAGEASNETYITTAFSKLPTSVTGYTNANYSLKAKLRVPFADVDKDYDGAGGYTWTDSNLFTGAGTFTPVIAQVDAVYSALIIPSGINLSLSNSSNLIVGGLVHSCSATINRGVVMNNGIIYANAGSSVQAYGYIKGSGRIELASGSVAIDTFRIYDWLGGGAAGGLNTVKIFPVNAYSIHNISCNLKINSGSTYEGFWTIQFQNRLYTGFQKGDENGNIKMISSSGALFSLSSGYIMKYTTNLAGDNSLSTITGSNQILGQKDKYDIYGTAIDGAVSIKIAASGTSFTMTSSTEMSLPISFSDFTLKSGSELTIQTASYKFYPGTTLAVDYGATLNVNNGASLLFYTVSDAIADEAKRTGAPFITTNGGYCKERKDSTLSVGGKVNIDSGSGLAGTVLVKPTNSLHNDYGEIDFVGKASCSILYPTSYTDGSPMDTWETASRSYNAKIYLYDFESNTVNSELSSAGDGKTYYAKFDENSNGGWYEGSSLTISYNTNGSSTSIGSTEVRIPSGTEFVISNSNITSTIPVRKHYEFGGWYLDAECQDSAIGKGITSDVTLFAKWTPINYTINYSYNDFSSVTDYDSSAGHIELSDNYSTTYNVETLAQGSNTTNSFNFLTPTYVFNDPTETKEYIFDGWYLDSACTQKVNTYSGLQLINAIGNAGPYNITLYGKWREEIIEDITINFNYVGINDSIVSNYGLSESTTIGGTTINYNPKDYSLDDDINRQYYFDGWYTDSNCTNKYNDLIADLTISDNTTTLYGKWSTKQYTINYGNIVEYYKDSADISNRSTINGYETIWFTSSSKNSTTYYRSSNTLYTGNDKTLYGEDYYILKPADTSGLVTQAELNAINSLTSNKYIFLDKVNFSNIELILNVSNTSKDDVTVNKGGGLYGISINKVIFSNCTLIDGLVKYAHYTESGTCGGSTNYCNTYYFGLLDSQNIDQIIFINTSLTNIKYLFSNYKGTINSSKVISNTALTIEKQQMPNNFENWKEGNEIEDAGYASSTVSIPATRNNDVKDKYVMTPIVLISIMSLLIVILLVILKRNKMKKA